MATKKPLAIPIGPDPKGWSDIRSAWSRSRHQVASQGKSKMEILRDFLVPTLADLTEQPDRLSPLFRLEASSLQGGEEKPLF